MTITPRPAPTSIRFTGEHRRLIDAALKQAGIKRTMIGWFPCLLVILLTHYVADANLSPKGTK